MKNKEDLVKSIMEELAQLKSCIDTGDDMTLDEYDYQYGDVEEIQYKMFLYAKRIGVV